MSYSEEPWFVSNSPGVKKTSVWNEDGILVANFGETKSVHLNCARENAMRAVACVNACEGIPTYQLTAEDDKPTNLGEMIDLLRKQRDELLAALEKQVADAKHCQNVMLNEVGVGFLDVVTLANSETVIARAKGVA